ncbi:uncharacterized protein LOC144139176 isoform X1 [Haemaphysalis longicornis]
MLSETLHLPHLPDTLKRHHSQLGHGKRGQDGLLSVQVLAHGLHCAAPPFGPARARGGLRVQSGGGGARGGALLRLVHGLHEEPGSSSAGVPVVAFPLGEMSRQAAGGGNGGQSQARGWVSASALANLFVCHVCRDYVRPPILQCHNGPFICCSCRQKITRCPTGRAPISQRAAASRQGIRGAPPPGLSCHSGQDAAQSHLALSLCNF